jgi:hypothetical protein
MTHAHAGIASRVGSWRFMVLAWGQPATTGWFDGHIATELRLWDALEQKLFSPFHHYGAGHESLDFSKAGWSNGCYTTAAWTTSSPATT